MIKNNWITFKMFPSTDIHKWKSFIQFPTFLDASNTIITQYSADCSFLGGLYNFWKHFLQADKQYHSSPKSSWSTAGVVSIFRQIHSNHTVYCHMGQSGREWSEIPGICMSNNLLITITIDCNNTAWRHRGTGISLAVTLIVLWSTASLSMSRAHIDKNS